MLTTLGALRADTLDRADMDQGGPISNAQANQRINAAIGVVYDAIIKVRGDQYFETDTTFSTVSGTQIYSFTTIGAPTLLKISAGGIWWLTGTGQNLPINKYNPNESELQLTNQGWYWQPYASTVPVRYRVRNGSLRFVPIPLGSYQVKVNYIPRPPVLVNDSDTWDGFDGFEEAVKWHAAASCMSKQQADTTEAMMFYQSEIQRLLDNVDIDNAEPPQVQWHSPVTGFDCDW